MNLLCPNCGSGNIEQQDLIPNGYSGVAVVLEDGSRDFEHSYDGSREYGDGAIHDVYWCKSCDWSDATLDALVPEDDWAAHAAAQSVEAMREAFRYASLVTEFAGVGVNEVTVLRFQQTCESLDALLAQHRLEVTA